MNEELRENIMTEQEVNKYLTEQMGGKLVDCCIVDGEEDIDETCVRQDNSEFPIDDCTYGSKGRKPEDCKYWQKIFIDGITDFSTPDGFFKAWNWAREQEWWGKFTATFTIDGIQTPWIPEDIIDPTNFANALAEFLKAK